MSRENVDPRWTSTSALREYLDHLRALTSSLEKDAWAVRARRRRSRRKARPVPPEGEGGRAQRPQATPASPPPEDAERRPAA